MKVYNFEMANYDLSGIFVSENSEVRFQIAKVLVRLPEEVREVVTERCRFFVPDHEYGRVWGGQDFQSDYIIFLSQQLAEMNKEEDALSIIAHEIAHAYLSHSTLTTDGIECEKEACEQALAWDFSGIGTDLKYCYEDKLL